MARQPGTAGSMFRDEFQGNLLVPLLTTKGANPLAKWGVSPRAHVSKTYDRATKGFVVPLEAPASICIPATPRASLGIVQPTVLVELLVPDNAKFSIELGVITADNVRRRLCFSTSYRSSRTDTPLHAKISLASLPRSEWFILCLGVRDLVAECFSVEYQTLLSVSLGPGCIVRRVASARPPAAAFVDDAMQDELFADKMDFALDKRPDFIVVDEAVSLDDSTESLSSPVKSARVRDPRRLKSAWQPRSPPKTSPPARLARTAGPRMNRRDKKELEPFSSTRFVPSLSATQPLDSEASGVFFYASAPRTPPSRSNGSIIDAPLKTSPTGGDSAVARASPTKSGRLKSPNAARQIADSSTIQARKPHPPSTRRNGSGRVRTRMLSDTSAGPSGPLAASLNPASVSEFPVQKTHSRASISAPDKLVSDVKEALGAHSGGHAASSPSVAPASDAVPKPAPTTHIDMPKSQHVVPTTKPGVLPLPSARFMFADDDFMRDESWRYADSDDESSARESESTPFSIFQVPSLSDGETQRSALSVQPSSEEASSPAALSQSGTAPGVGICGEQTTSSGGGGPRRHVPRRAAPLTTLSVETATFESEDDSVVAPSRGSKFFDARKALLSQLRSERPTPLLEDENFEERPFSPPIRLASLRVVEQRYESDCEEEDVGEDVFAEDDNESGERSSPHSLASTSPPSAAGSALATQGDVVDVCSSSDDKNAEAGEEELELLYDPVLNCYFNPATNRYYELA
eukprot:m.11775 g.11775  ORF g.11775 m.11775 type:complete len:748 (+) comp3177_c0_seq2:129-2372(+)